MDPRVQLLTKREIELLHHVFLGRRTAEIAQIEGIANQTVLNRLQDARGKLGGVDRRTAALMVATAKGWVPGIKATPPQNTLSAKTVERSSGSVSQVGWRADRGGDERVSGLQPEGTVFVKTFSSEEPASSPRRRNHHDVTTRISMLLLRTAFLVAMMVALLWVYGRV